MTEEVLLTKEGLEKIKEEYDRHVSVTRAEVAERIKEARSFGDLSENAEYDAAKQEQAELEERINKLESMMRNAKIIDEDSSVEGIVNIGNTVIVKEKGSKEKVKFQIVGATEADPFEGKISNESAVGKALIGNKKGDTVEVEVIDGKITYKIMEIVS
ncbi:MAG: transcription elongation factor GreA [[Eubacterium] brachy]|jgi:transcription elongation factor greA|nr:transcription elongation factor GreA [Eubacterium brachy ATCC 33089]MBF1134135.1 transcription elongation factor GreA [[Eubacterium] brachy]